MEKTKPNGIILCGGRSRRMGQNKALLKLGERTIIEQVANTLSKICNEIIISTNSEELNFLPFKIIKDKLTDIGPIAGFHSTLMETSNEHNLIVSCDTPFITTEILEYLFSMRKNYDVVLPVFKDQIQPMTGYFRKSLFRKIEEEIQLGNRKPINIFENSNLLLIDVNKDFKHYKDYLFFNINSPEDYKQAKAIYDSNF